MTLKGAGIRVRDGQRVPGIWGHTQSARGYWLFLSTTMITNGIGWKRLDCFLNALDYLYSYQMDGLHSLY